MTRVALVTNGISSTLNAGLAFAGRLRARGDDVTVVSHADVGRTVEANGFPFVRLESDREAFAAVRTAASRMRTGGPVGRASAVFDLARALVRGRRCTARAEELLGAIEAIDPDIALIDIEEHVAIAALAPGPVPVALTTFLFAIEERAGVPPLDAWCDPADGACIRREWERTRRASRRTRRRRLRSRRGLVDLLGPISYRTTSRVALRAVARRSGFDLAAHTDVGQWLRPHGYVGLPVLTTNLRELDLGDGAGDDWTYIGPMVADGRREVAASAEWSRWIDSRDAERPLVYCTLGSYWSADARLLGEVVRSAVRRPDWDVVIGLGGQGDAGALGDLPPNVLVLDWAPQLEVLSHASAAIVHGGNASLNECVVAAVPMVVCSTGHLDQNGIAVRVERAGIGVRLDGATAGADAIETALDRCLGDASVRSSIERLSAVAESDRYATSAVRAVDQLVAGIRVAGTRAEGPGDDDSSADATSGRP